MKVKSTDQVEKIGDKKIWSDLQLQKFATADCRI